MDGRWSITKPSQRLTWKNQILIMKKFQNYFISLVVSFFTEAQMWYAFKNLLEV